MAAYPETLAHPSGAQLALVPDVVLVKVASAPGASASDALGALGLVPLGYGGGADGPGAGALARAELPHAAVNDSPGLVFARTREGGGVDRDTVTASSEVEWTAPVYRTQVRGRDELLSPLATTLVLASDVARDPEKAAVLEEYELVRNDARSALLGSFDLFDVPGATRPAFDIRDELAARLGTEVKLEFIPVVTPVAFQPDDPLFVQQWDMVQIDAGGAGDSAWDHQRGDSMIAVAVLDEGVDLAHPDLVGAFLHDGINLGTMSGTGAPTGNHGTPCAGIAAAPIGNATGTSGVGGGAKILPIAVQSWSAEEIAAGIRYATAQGARVISMSFGWDLWDPTVIDPAIAEAHAAEVVMCVATHNHDTQDGVTYPATNPLVMAVGASDRVDNRKSPSSPDGEQWGSNWGPQVSVVAPGVQCPAPDRTGADGYSADDYTTTFNGTSAATPHVAGLAALLLSRNPLLTGAEVRRIIETTAAKVGTVAYADDPAHPHGTWNAEMGYGRIDALAAVSATDLWVGEELPTCRVDLTGDGRADIVGFGDFGVFVSLNNGDGTFGPVTQVSDNFAHEAGGWRVGKHPRMLADLTGDGRADIVGFGDFGVFVALNNGDGTFGPVTQVVDNFAHEAGGWRVGKHPRMLADLTGDGRADIVGFGDFGVFVSLNNGDGTFGPVTQVV
ncbi:S8 family serine peptidase, partial [Cellulomonas cellasea]|uniref:S8 family serine peptidase n=2 Tax=Cellulomonas cellasea TaxID=43670 RepID=UPI0012F761BC